MKKFSTSTSWFFTELPSVFKLSSIFIKGDLIVLLPLIGLIVLTGFISLKFMLLLLGAYISIRYFGEMIYWLLQQFGERRYRPDDFGFKNLDNHSIYILYQTLAIAWTVAGVAIIIAAIIFMK